MAGVFEDEPLIFGDDDDDGIRSFSGDPPKTGPNTSKKRKAPATHKPKQKCTDPAGAKKEKLGGRIRALQQLVSPFGKTDTASVLHGALGYIGFLQDQVHVLCSPYLQQPSSNLHPPGDDHLRSRGLCLVPLELTLHLPDSNGADLWSSLDP